MTRPFHVIRPFHSDEAKWWLSGRPNDPAKLRRVIPLPWNKKWDLWARVALITGALIPPRSKYYGDERLARGTDE